MKSRSLLVTIAVALTAAACGGGGASGPDTAVNGGGGTTGSSKTTPGLWQGTVTSSTTGTSSLVGLTDSSGRGVWMTTDGRVWSGQMPVTGTQMAVDMAGYMYPGRQFPDGSNVGPWSMTGNFANGTWSGQLHGAGDVVSFGLSMMNPAYGRPASLDTLAGTYTRTTSVGYTMTMSVTGGGQLTGSDSRGCMFNGTVTVPDPAHDLYRIEATVTSCGILNGSYQGQGTLLDASAMQAWMSSMGCYQYGAGGWNGGMMGGGMMGGMGGWWPYTGTNTVPTGTNNLFMFAMTGGGHAIMDALAR
jgi:hypothetical protein